MLCSTNRVSLCKHKLRILTQIEQASLFHLKATCLMTCCSSDGSAALFVPSLVPCTILSWHRHIHWSCIGAAAGQVTSGKFQFQPVPKLVFPSNTSYANWPYPESVNGCYMLLQKMRRFSSRIPVILNINMHAEPCMSTAKALYFGCCTLWLWIR